MLVDPIILVVWISLIALIILVSRIVLGLQGDFEWIFRGFSGDFEMILLRFKRISILFVGFEGIFRKFRLNFDGIVRGC